MAKETIMGNTGPQPADDDNKVEEAMEDEHQMSFGSPGHVSRKRKAEEIAEEEFTQETTKTGEIPIPPPVAHLFAVQMVNDVDHKSTNSKLRLDDASKMKTSAALELRDADAPNSTALKLTDTDKVAASAITLINAPLAETTAEAALTVAPRNDIAYNEPAATAALVAEAANITVRSTGPFSSGLSATTLQPKEMSITSSNNNNSYENLRWVTVSNDGKPDSMVKLIGLKSLFAKQLPKMPRAYIARLVMDRRHTSLAILSDNPAVAGSDEEIIGGICYRAFPEMRFAEIAFCAVNATHQVKGYGTKLMNLLKQSAVQTGIEFFITYADNYAIGYFKKQGFTKLITMPKGRYFGLIKDYDGGTPMECYVHPSIDYFNLPALIQAQRDYILQRVALTTNSLTVYPPLPSDFAPSLEGVSRANLSAAKALTVPGVMEAGWTLPDLLQSALRGDDARLKSSALKQELLGMIRKIEEQQFAWPFREPVDLNEVPDYLDVVTTPIDLKTIVVRIRQDNHYKSKQMLFADLLLMVNNCKLYNEDGSTYSQCATSLEKFVRAMFPDP